MIVCCYLQKKYFKSKLVDKKGSKIDDVSKPRFFI